MNSIVILFAVAAAIAAAAAVEQEQYHLPRELVDLARKIGLQCADEHKVDRKNLARVLDGTLPTDDATNNFLYCITFKTGYVTEDGHLAVENIASIVKDHPLAEAYRAALEKCNGVTKETPQATIAVANKCFATETPIRFTFQ